MCRKMYRKISYRSAGNYDRKIPLIIRPNVIEALGLQPISWHHCGL
jgi:hypothetical protein